MVNSLVPVAQRLLADQRIRFLLVGAFNTVFGLAIYTLFELTFGRHIGEFGFLVSVAVSYAIAIPVAFFLHRKLVFKPIGGNAWVDFGRFVLTNAVGFGLNLLLLPPIVLFFRYLAGSLTENDYASVIGQPLIQIFVVLVTYFLHKHFSFRRTAPRTRD